MIFRRLFAAKLLAASTFGLYSFEFRKAWAEELPLPDPPAPIVQPAVQPPVLPVS